MKITLDTNKNWLFLFAMFTLWSNTLPGITISGIGTLFPLRIMVFFVGVLYLLNRRWDYLYQKTVIRLLGLLLYGLVSLLWCIDISTGIQTFVIYITSIFTVFTTFVLVKNEKDIITLCRYMAINAIVIGLMGIYESVTGNYFILTKERYLLDRVVNTFGFKYPHSIFYNTNDFAAFMVAMVPIMCIAVKDLKYAIVLQYSALALSTICIVFTNSRLCQILCVVYFIFLLPKKNIKSVLTIIPIVLIVFIVGTRYWDRLYYNVLGISGINIADEGRITIWENSFVNFLRSGTFGVGIGNSTIANEQYSYHPSLVYAVHNFLLEILEEFGLFGFVCFFSWLVLIVKKLTAYWEQETGKYLVSFFVIFSFLTILSSSIRQMYYFWLILSLCIVFIKDREANVNTSYESI